MQNSKTTNVELGTELRELVDFEVADILATAKEQGFSAHDALAALAASVEASLAALGEVPEAPADPPPAGPHAQSDLVDREKTPGTGALPEPKSGDVDPGVG